MGQQVSDLFFTDNPNRRKRAAQLRQSVLDFSQKFEEEKKKRDQLFTQARDKLDALLKSQGIQTREQLIQLVKSKLDDDVEIKKYDEFIKSVDPLDKAMTTIMDIASLATLGTGVVASLAWVVGIVSGAVAIAAIEVVGGLAAAVVVIVLVWTGISGKIERQKLREAIYTLWNKRAEAYLYLSRMRVINDSVRDIVRSLDQGRSIQYMAKDLEDFKAQWDDCTLQKMQAELLQIDIEQHSWTNEDPDNFSYRAADSYAVQNATNEEDTPTLRLECFHPRTNSKHIFIWSLDEILSRSVCVVSDQRNRWIVTAKGDLDTAPEDQVWNVQCVPKDTSVTSNFLEDCSITVLETSHH